MDGSELFPGGLVRTRKLSYVDDADNVCITCDPHPKGTKVANRRAFDLLFLGTSARDLRTDANYGEYNSHFRLRATLALHDCGFYDGGLIRVVLAGDGGGDIESFDERYFALLSERIRAATPVGSCWRRGNTTLEIASVREDSPLNVVTADGNIVFRPTLLREYTRIENEEGSDS